MTHSSTQTLHSACRMCHGVHQVLVQLEGNHVVKVSSDPDSLLGSPHIRLDEYSSYPYRNRCSSQLAPMALVGRFFPRPAFRWQISRAINIFGPHARRHSTADSRRILRNIEADCQNIIAVWNRIPGVRGSF